MIRPKSLMTWVVQAMRRDDPALRRISNLKACQHGHGRSSVPLFFRQKAPN